MPDAMNRPMAVQLSVSGGSAMTSAARRITWTREPTMTPVMGFDSFIPFRAMTLLAP